MKKKKEREMVTFMKEIFRIVISFLTHRLFVITIIILLMFSILFARLFNLQIINGSKLEEEFELSVLRDVDIEGQRGLIYDRYGTPLAVNEVAYSINYDNSVYTSNRNILLLDLIRIIRKNNDSLSIEFPILLDQDKNFEFINSNFKVVRFKKDIFGETILLNEEEDNQEKIDEYLVKMDYDAEEMINYLIDEFFEIDRDFIIDNGVTTTELLDLVIIRHALWIKGYYKFIPQVIAVNISDETLAVIQENKVDLPGVSIVEDSIRKYLYPNYTAHIIGYTGTIDDKALNEFEPYGYDQNDTVGRIGIEEAMELYLHSVDGYQQVEVDIHGRTKNVIEETEPTAGKDVYLTIDLDLQIATQDLLVKQLNNIISQKLVLKLPTYGEDRLPLLKDVYYSLFENETIDIEKIMKSREESFSLNILNDYSAYYSAKTEAIYNSLVVSDVTLNDKLSRYYDYILKTLEDDRLLNSDHENSDGYNDFNKENISFKGLLKYYIKENYIVLDRVLEKQNMTSEGMTDQELYDFLLEDIVKNDYFNRHVFKNNIFLEMTDNEQFNYLDLSMVLIEQKIVSVTEEVLEKLLSRRLSPLDYMKQLIMDIELTPQQLALDPSTGAAVIVDVDTGEVLALVSYPSYDNNRISDYSYYQELLNDPTKPLYPTATQGKTAPGSTFKMMTAVAGLEEEVIYYHDSVRCTGHFTKVSPNVSCWIAAYGGAHGPVNVVTAIAVSCNSFFNEVGYRLGITEDGSYSPQLGVERLAKYAAMFGLNTTTGIELVESKPSTPGNTDSGTVNPVTAAMGQEFNAYTPTQMARYIATIANGGTLYELTLIDRIYNSDSTLFMEKKPTITQVNDFKEGTIAAVHEGMKEVTTGSRGTARSFYYNFPVSVAGKTGTAQENKQRASHAVFASFAPADDPEIAIIVAIPYSYTSPFSSGYIVGTVARDIYAVYYDIYKENHGYSYEQEMNIE